MIKGYYNNQSYIANEISEDIPAILKKFQNGNVHSVFNTSFNLIFDEHIVHIGSMENGLAPFGIGLEKLATHQLTQKVQIGMKVTFVPTKNVLIFENGCSLQLSNVSVVNHLIKQSSFDSVVLETNVKDVFQFIRTNKWTFGFVQSEEEKQQLFHFLFNKKVEDTDIIIYLQRLIELIKGSSKQDATAVFNYWMGRGSGLTPSGDDILTGACAVIILLQGKDNHFTEKLREYLLANGRNRTTQIAYEYLLYATEQKFHSHLLQLCKQLVEQDKEALAYSLKNLLQVGHTSGADTLLGTIIGCKAYLNL